jgi:hypothetical protein
VAIILYCKNGHDLGTHDNGRLGHTMRSYIARAERAQREAMIPRQPFCTQCGAPTLDACPHCQHKIAKRPRPAFCGQCGKTFPWTESALFAAKEYTAEAEGLNAEEKTALIATFNDLTVDTPRTELAAHRFKEFLKKLAPDVGEGIKKTIVEIASETAAKLLKPGR